MTGACGSNRKYRSTASSTIGGSASRPSADGRAQPVLASRTLAGLPISMDISDTACDISRRSVGEGESSVLIARYPRSGSAAFSGLDGAEPGPVGDDPAGLFGAASGHQLGGHFPDVLGLRTRCREHLSVGFFDDDDGVRQGLAQRARRRRGMPRRSVSRASTSCWSTTRCTARS